jgi:cation diffusion facilitator family transporter
MQEAGRAERMGRKKRAAMISIVSNSLLVVLKLVVGFWTGSVGVLSEAFHSATDLMASGIALVSVRFADIPPDEQHPYGHGKVESLSGLVEAVLIFLAAVYIIYESIAKLAAGHREAFPVGAGLAVMIVSILVNSLISRYLFRVAAETDSLALHADAEHLRSDVYTSFGVLFGLTLVHFTGKSWLDSATALLVALFIIRTSFQLSHDAYHLLLDTRLPAEEEHQILDILESEPQVLGYHKLRTRKSGSQRHADVHVQVDDNYTLLAAHDLAEELEDRIRAVLPDIAVNIHIEPYHAEMQHQREKHGAKSE